MGLLDFIGDRLKVLHKSGNMPTAKSKAGFHFVSMEKRKAILVVSRGVVHTLWDTENYKTKKETDDALALKATQKEVDDHAKSIDVLSSTKAEKSVVDALQNGIIKQAAVDTYNDTSDGKTSLLNKYPTPKLGWDVLVKSENTRYNWNGSMWVDMETGNYPEDVVLKNDVFGIPTYPFIQDFGALEDKAFVEWQQAFPYIEYENGTKYPNAFYGIGLVRVLPDSNMFRVAIYGYYYNGSYYYIDATKSINIYATSRDEIVEFDINDADYDVKIKGLIDFSKLPEGDHIAKQFIFTDVIGVKQEIKALSVIVEENKSKGLKEPDIEVSIKTEQGLWMQKRVITVNKPNAVAGDQTNFNNLVDAVLSITDASETNPYEIQLYADIIATQKTDYHPIDNNTYALGWLKKHITIRGMGDTKTIYGELPEGLTQAEYSSYVGLHYDGGGILENIKVIAKSLFKFH